jgi:hypothetical protein
MFYRNRVKIVTIYKNLFSNHDKKNIFKSLIKRKELEPEPEPKLRTADTGGNLVLAPRQISVADP